LSDCLIVCHAMFDGASPHVPCRWQWCAELLPAVGVDVIGEVKSTTVRVPALLRQSSSVPPCPLPFIVPSFTLSSSVDASSRDHSDVPSPSTVFKKHPAASRPSGSEGSTPISWRHAEGNSSVLAVTASAVKAAASLLCSRRARKPPVAAVPAGGDRIVTAFAWNSMRSQFAVATADHVVKVCVLLLGDADGGPAHGGQHLLAGVPMVHTVEIGLLAGPLLAAGVTALAWAPFTLGTLAVGTGYVFVYVFV
jgi:hypothetical protein